MSLTLGPSVTEDSVNVLTNKTLSAESNQISDLEVDNLKSGVLDTALVNPVDHSTLASAKATRIRLDERLKKDQNLGDIPSAPQARTNLEVFSKQEVLEKIRNSEDENDTFGDVVVSRNAQGDVVSIITTTTGGRVKTELFTYNANGDVNTIQTIVPALNINKTETYLYDASGDFIGISV